ncbi:MAG: hypothetical protein K2K36_03780, partial [Muribaculaceae bacterium]|nr:hypothetical protein [Muribaculaceae bacterium]
GVVRVTMRRSAPVYLTYDASGAFRLRGAMSVPAPMAFSAEGDTLVSEQIGTIKLSGEGLQGGTLSGADLRTVSGVFTAAYRRLMRRASGAGVLVHPVLARYRLEDEAGDTLFVSPPVLVAGAQGFQCTAPVVQWFSGSAAVTGGALQVRGYAVRLEAPATALPEPWRSMVRRAVVEISEEIDPVEADGLCTAAVTSDGSGNLLHVTLPGPGVRSGAARSLLVEGMLRRSPGCMRAVAVIDRPFSPEFKGRAVTPAVPGSGVEAQGAPAVWAPWRDGVSYGAAGSCHGLFCGASPVRQLFASYPPEQFAVGRGGEGAWQGVASVTLRRGNGREETAVATGYGASGVPQGFSGVLTYPDADATLLRISVRNPDGAVSTQSFPLQSWPEGGMAYWVAPEGSVYHRLSSEAAELSVPAATAGALTREGTVVVAPEERPGSPLCLEEAGCGRITAVADAPRSGGSWDFSRRKLLAYGSGGTTLLTLDGKLALHSSARIDLREVTFATAATGSKGEVHLALAGGALVETGASGTRTIMTRAGASSAAYDPVNDEYLLAGGGSLPRRVNGRGEETTILADGCGSDAGLITWEGRPLLASASCLRDCTAADAGAMVRCSFTERYEISGGSGRREAELLELTLPLVAGEARGALTVSADNGSGAAAVLVTLTLNGALRAPLPVAVPWPGRRFLEISFRGYLSSDARWAPPSARRGEL